MKELQKIIYKKDKDSIKIGMELLVVKPLAQDQSNKSQQRWLELIPCALDILKSTSIGLRWYPLSITEQSSKRSKSNYPHNSSNQT